MSCHSRFISAKPSGLTKEPQGKFSKMLNVSGKYLGENYLFIYLFGGVGGGGVSERRSQLISIIITQHTTGGKLQN